jgi:exodeoxyribonuclease VII small subunit
VGENMENEENESNEMSFEESLKELEAIVRRLEMGDVPLDDAIDEFHKAMVLVKTCDKKLNEAKESIAHLVKENGDIIDFNVDE